MLIPHLRLDVKVVCPKHPKLVKSKAQGLFIVKRNENRYEIYIADNDESKDTFLHELTHFLIEVMGKSPGLNCSYHNAKFKRILKMLKEELE
jgi:hypothetical protein